MSSLFKGPDIPKPPKAPAPPSSIDVANTTSARNAYQGATGGGSTVATGPNALQRTAQFSEGVDAAKRKKKDTTEFLG